MLQTDGEGMNSGLQVGLQCSCFGICLNGDELPRWNLILETKCQTSRFVQPISATASLAFTVAPPPVLQSQSSHEQLNDVHLTYEPCLGGRAFTLFLACDWLASPPLAVVHQDLLQLTGSEKSCLICLRGKGRKKQQKRQTLSSVSRWHVIDVPSDKRRFFMAFFSPCPPPPAQRPPAGLLLGHETAGGWRNDWFSFASYGETEASNFIIRVDSVGYQVKCVSAVISRCPGSGFFSGECSSESHRDGNRCRRRICNEYSGVVFPGLDKLMLSADSYPQCEVQQRPLDYTQFAPAVNDMASHSFTRRAGVAVIDFIITCHELKGKFSMSFI